MALLHTRVSTRCCSAELAAAAHVVFVPEHQGAFAATVDRCGCATGGPGPATALRRDLRQILPEIRHSNSRYMCLLRYTVFQLLLSSVDQVGVKTLSINITDNQLMFWLFLDPIVSIPFFDHEVQLACDDDDHHHTRAAPATTFDRMS